MIQIIDTALYKVMLSSAAALLEQNRQQINELNVFPVPDGDTGTNMSLTLNSGVTALTAGGTVTVSACADVVASALLRGARGNSGVILSLIFRGMYKSIRGLEQINAQDFANALSSGVSAAYKAVMRPTEGTILTVSRRTAEAAQSYVKENDDFEGLFERMIVVGDAALKETTSQNPVLKKAKVVDAGAMGYLCILRGMLSAIKGEPVKRSVSDTKVSTSAFSAFTDEDITFTFDTVFIVRKTANKSVKPLEAYLNSIGDSLVISEDDTAFKVHVHTDIPGNALSEAQKYGTLEIGKIENMRLQYQDAAAGRKTRSADELDDEEEEHEKELKQYGFVSVCAGDGIGNVFKDLGVDALVTGGQTMNPAAEDILNAVNSVPAKTVFVLPNNKNIIMAAQQCKRMTTKNVVVIPSKSIPQGIAAMFCFEESMSAEELETVMSNACDNVHTAMVTYAARDSVFDGVEIHEGEYLALLESSLLTSTDDIDALIGSVSASLREFDPEVLTVFYGEDANEEMARLVEKHLSASYPAADITVINGGQPVYYFIISAE